MAYVRDMARIGPVVSVEVTAADVRVLVPGQRKSAPEAGLSADVLAAIEAYADRVTEDLDKILASEADRLAALDPPFSEPTRARIASVLSGLHQDVHRSEPVRALPVQVSHPPRSRGTGPQPDPRGASCTSSAS